MAKIALDAGHGINTPGKRTPDGEREWTFNNKVIVACIKYLAGYENATVIRLDDPKGNKDISLAERTRKANSQGADILVSCHHNANTGQWGTWTGTETYHYPGSSSGLALARKIHPGIVGAMGLRDRGIKAADFHVLRESNMPAVLIEGGFMDSTIDIVKMRDNNVLDRVGKELAEAIADYFDLKKKSGGSTGTHKVKKGDTLWGIAQKNKVSVNTLKALNNLSSDTIHPGQMLKVKSSGGSSSKTHTVKSGDTLWGIAQKNNTTVAKIKSANGLKSDTIHPGDKLKV